MEMIFFSLVPPNYSLVSVFDFLSCQLPSRALNLFLWVASGTTEIQVRYLIRCVGLVAEVPEHRQKTTDTILALVTTPAIKVFYGVQSRSFEEK